MRRPTRRRRRPTGQFTPAGLGTWTQADLMAIAALMKAGIDGFGAAVREYAERMARVNASVQALARPSAPSPSSTPGTPSH